MKFTIAIEARTKKCAFGVAVPDLPGCFSAGDTVEEAFDNVREAIEAHCEILAEEGKGWTWGIVDVQSSDFRAGGENQHYRSRPTAKAD